MMRALAAADVPAVQRVIDATDLFPSDLLHDMVAGYLASATTDEIWLAATDPDLVGVAYCAPERLTDGTWNLYLIAVHPDVQRQGHGAALVGAVERRVKEADGRVLLIETSGLGSFAGQRSFYQGLGYREEARIHDFYRVGEDKVVFWKALAATPGSSDGSLRREQQPPR